MMNKTYEKGIYIHIPFCVHKCIYCDFLSAPADDDVKIAYTKALINEIRMTADKYPAQLITSVFLGGGTPSVMPYGCIGDILDTIKQCFRLSDDAQITIECNPGTIDKRKLKEYKAAGVNRISFGLQSADDRELKMLGRIHTFADFVESYGMARETGFNNINIDVMSAIPGQDMESLEYTLRKVMEMSSQHISVYSLILEEGTYLADNINDYPEVPDEDMDRQMYHMTRRILAENGYDRYEISNYCRKGYECTHNLLYWNRGEYWGFGCSAAGLIDNKRYCNIRNVVAYIRADGNPEIVRDNIEVMSDADEMEEFMFLGLRKIEGINIFDFRQRFGKSIDEIYEKEIKDNIEKKLLERNGDFLRLTEKGLDICNTVMSDFILTV